MSAGNTIGLIVNFLICGLIFGVLGTVCDRIINTANSNITTLMLSQDCINLLTNLSIIFKLIPFLYLIALIINHFVESSNEEGGYV